MKKLYSLCYNLIIMAVANVIAGTEAPVKAKSAEKKSKRDQVASLPIHNFENVTTEEKDIEVTGNTATQNCV